MDNYTKVELIKYCKENQIAYSNKNKKELYNIVINNKENQIAYKNKENQHYFCKKTIKKSKVDEIFDTVFPEYGPSGDYYYLYNDIISVFGNNIDKTLFKNFTNTDLIDNTKTVFFVKEGVNEESSYIIIGLMRYLNTDYYYCLDAFSDYYTGFKIGGDYRIYITLTEKMLWEKCLSRELRDEYLMLKC